MKILIACEESQAVCKAFREIGHEAYSCDLQECSGGHPEWHIQQDAIEVAYSGVWDLMVAHPPCTHLAVSGQWAFTKGLKEHYLKDESANFFMKLIRSPIKMIAVENPVCIMSTLYRKPDQVIHPWQFGHTEQKATCLWLKNLPHLMPTKIVYHQMMQLPKKERERILYMGSKGKKQRSVTYPGIADAMANQWGNPFYATKTLF